MDNTSYIIRVPKRLGRMTAIVGVLALIVAPLAAVATHSFNDVPDSHTFHEDIEWLKASGVTKGCNPPANTLFCPDDNVTRGQMAAFMERFAGYLGAGDGTPAQADNASTADHATTADDADNADSLGGKDASEYAENLWAAVNSDGSLARGAHVVSTDRVTPTGRYEVIFDRDVSECGFVATNGLADSVGVPSSGEIGVNGRDTDPNGVFVITWDSAGTQADRGFHLSVFCGATSVASAATGSGGGSQDAD